MKEQNDAEDAENARHREKIVEINTRYQEKLPGLRAQQVNQRQEFLRKESEVWSRQYHETGIGHHYMNTGLQDAPGYSGTAVAGTGGEAHQTYAFNKFESYQDRPPSVGSGRTLAEKELHILRVMFIVLELDTTRKIG